jgi:hypothetical protein
MEAAKLAEWIDRLLAVCEGHVLAKAALEGLDVRTLAIAVIRRWQEKLGIDPDR